MSHLSPGQLAPCPRWGWWQYQPQSSAEKGRLLKVPGIRPGSKGRLVVPFGTLHMVTDDGLDQVQQDQWSLNPKAFEHQKKGVSQALAHQRYLLAFDMGTGKTFCGVEWLRLSREACETPFRALVVCPGSVRPEWVEHLTCYLPSFEGRLWPDHPEIYVADTGKRAAATPPSAQIVVTGYRLLSKLPPEYRPTYVVLDECHYAKKQGRDRTEAVKKVLARQPQPGYRLFLTGTPIDQNPVDLYMQGNLLVEGMFGRHVREFESRYCIAEKDEYAYSGLVYHGLNEEHAEELKARLAEFCMRVTKSEVQHLMPALTVQPFRYRAPKRSLKEILDWFNHPALHKNGNTGRLMEVSVDAKIKVISQMVSETQGSHLAILCHRKATAKKLAELFKVPCITGALTALTRRKLVKQLAQDGGTFVATMDSLKEGISLPEFNEIIYVELDWHMSKVVQSMNRYHRISGSKPVRIRIPILEGTYEEAVAATLQERLADAARLLDAGETEQKLDAALDEDEDDEAFLASIREVAATQYDEDEFLG